MLPPLLVVGLLQLAGTAPAPAADSSPPRYATPSLRAVVARAVERNRAVPSGLQSYRARMRTEMGAVLRRPEGGEAVAQVEQVENEVRWRRPGSYEQRVIGYRTQAVGPNISMLSNFRQAWTVPLLYGNRLNLLFGRRDTTKLGAKERERIAKRRSEQGPSVAVHPFAQDRDQYYRFAGGDTIAVMRLRGRAIPLVRVMVEPLDSIELPELPPGGRTDSTWSVVLFRGELDVDASRGHLVRMRGYFVEVRGGRPPRRPGLGTRVLTKVLTAGVRAVAYVELENAEIEERYWLPAYQRIEAQVSAAALGESRAVLRVVSRFRDYQVNDTAAAAPDEGATFAATGGGEGRGGADTLAPPPAEDTIVNHVHRLVWAPSDTLARFADWQAPIGVEVSSATSEDFDDIAPDVWRRTGPPRLDVRVQRFGDFLHFNRVEGLYTGYGATLRFRDAAPGVSLAASAGWAWSERTARGRVALERARGGWLAGLRAGRTLDITNDFRLPFDSGSSLGALLGVDAYDYVDRRAAALVLGRTFGERVAGGFGGGGNDAGGGAALRLEAGVGSDRYAARQLMRGLTKVDSGFRENRGVAEGDYWRTALSAELHPAVNIDFMRPGVGALVTYERADGFGARPLGWQRVEGRALVRREWGPLIYAARADAGAVFGAGGGPPPPQQLFELGEAQRLPGYGYKEFAGDRAAVARALTMYGLPYFRAPLRLGRYTLPAPAPALSFGVQSGWASVGDRESARRALSLLGTNPETGEPVSRPTNGVRTSVDVMVRFFGAALGLGVARPVDHPAPWRFVVGWGQML
ncbi:MAG TPA: hypothetical protein VKA84_16685 [Gemmatimonadaceae bacterium]|nr:hypothetical protein [Gemmatimonadaceae bacterium]